MQVAPNMMDIEAEQALLGALFINNEVARVVSGIVRPEFFADPLHGEIYNLACEMLGEGKSVNPITLSRRLPEQNGSDLATPAYLARLATSGATTVISAPDYAETIRDAWAARQLVALADEAKGQASATSCRPRQVITDMLGSLDAIRAEIDDQRMKRQTAGQVADEAMARIQRIRSGQVDKMVMTGLADIDHFVSGLKGGQLYIIAGRPGMGKSVLGASMARQAACNGVGIGFFSMEMHDEQIAARFLADQSFSSRAPLSFKDIIDGKKLSDEQMDRLEASTAELAALPLEIDLSSTLTVSEIAARTRTLADQMKKRGVKLGAIFIDYLKFVKASDRYRGQRVYEVGEITGGLKALAKDMDICVVLLAQLNRQVEARQDKRPELSDLRESGDIEADADVVMLLFRESYYLTDKVDAESQAKLAACENTLEIILAKNRNGPTRTIHSFCDVASSAVRNLSRY